MNTAAPGSSAATEMAESAVSAEFEIGPSSLFLSSLSLGISSVRDLEKFTTGDDDDVDDDDDDDVDDDDDDMFWEVEIEWCEERDNEVEGEEDSR